MGRTPMRRYMRRAPCGCNMRRAASGRDVGRVSTLCDVSGTTGRRDMSRNPDLHRPASQPAGFCVIGVLRCDGPHLHFIHLPNVFFQVAVLVNRDPIKRAVVLPENLGYGILVFSRNRGAGDQDRMFVNLNRVVTRDGRLSANRLAG